MNHLDFFPPFIWFWSSRRKHHSVFAHKAETFHGQHLWLGNCCQTIWIERTNPRMHRRKEVQISHSSGFILALFLLNNNQLLRLIIYEMFTEGVLWSVCRNLFLTLPSSLIVSIENVHERRTSFLYLNMRIPFDRHSSICFLKLLISALCWGIRMTSSASAVARRHSALALKIFFSEYQKKEERQLEILWCNCVITALPIR